jgi:hypothetical protein
VCDTTLPFSVVIVSPSGMWNCCAAIWMRGARQSG